MKIGELKKVFSPVHHENLRALLQYSAKEFADTTAFIVKTKKKKEVSDTLTEVLKTKQLKRRQCPDCGRALPYNYQYGICESCYSMRNRGYGYWGDEWFSDNKSKKEHV